MEKKEEVVWKDIPQYEGLYQVNNRGEIRSLERIAENQRRIVRTRILVPFNGGVGYDYVALYFKKKRKVYAVHRLVMKAFNGDSELTVNHIDENKRNNELTNLQYLTHAENCNYGSRNAKISAKAKLRILERGEDGKFRKKQENSLQVI